jgi:hypothetical protein
MRELLVKSVKFEVNCNCTSHCQRGERLQGSRPSILQELAIRSRQASSSNNSGKNSLKFLVRRRPSTAAARFRCPARPLLEAAHRHRGPNRPGCLVTNSAPGFWREMWPIRSEAILPCFTTGLILKIQYPRNGEDYWRSAQKPIHVSSRRDSTQDAALQLSKGGVRPADILNKVLGQQR